jgi:GNAT superfamily N-acetyltransferase
MIQVRRVVSKSDWDAFIDFPWSIYGNDPFWVPPLRVSVKDTLDVDKNPFFKHAYMLPLLAFRGEQIVGRVVGVIDDAHNKHNGEQTVFFGFFEAIDDQSVTDALLNEVATWGTGRGMTILRGPVSPSTNHECGLLVEGFEDAPAVMTTYNPPYYAKLLEGWGLTKSKDLMSYNIDSKTAKFSDRLLAHAEKVKQGGNVTFRPVRMSEFDKEVDQILEIYNDAWESNWGFVPMTPEEFRHMAKDMKAIVDPELLLIAEVRGEPVAFGLALPDVNQAIKLLWNLKGPGKKKTINRCRIITLGIKKRYQALGVGPVLYLEYLKRGPAGGYPVGEASWILEDNVPMNRALEHMCGQRTKVHRIYDRAL